ncbi:DNA glycosylase superfamily protein [Actinidia rufa]|uniref:DNA glycosylase superfamily protein n=1 Tax=Actinidia rufa TaxID=165716 RepID=A0A7J0DGI9_9ERIC|nr:DNA glycosylase superfamily protein [Actinidia rufa]
MARLLTATVAPPVAYRSTGKALSRVTEQRGSLSKSNRPSSVSNRSCFRPNDTILTRSEIISKQISHSHSPRRRLTVGSAFPTRLGRVSDKIGAGFRRASEKEAPIRGCQGDSPPLCEIPATKLWNMDFNPHYATFHDEEWGLPEHDDKRLFELLVFSGALAELSWLTILSKRHIFREVFADFDPMIVAKFSDKKITAPGSTASSLLSELKLRAIIENARQISKVIDEFGSFDKYIWSFVNYKPIISRSRYPRQIPVRTAKADVISKDLVRRGFRSVGPTVIYSFMQAAGITNDHLISCFRFQECVTAAEGKEADVTINGADDKKTAELIESDICRVIDELSFASE